MGWFDDINRVVAKATLGFDDFGLPETLFPFSPTVDPWKDPAPFAPLQTTIQDILPKTTVKAPVGIARAERREVGPATLPGPGPDRWFAKHQNGRIPIEALGEVPNGAGGFGYARSDVASAYEQMRVAAAGDGVTLSFTDSYRSYEAQLSCAARKGLYSQGGLCAKPGTSEHGWGMAFDMNLGRDPRMLEWLRSNASDFGFRSIPREPWHWEYRGGGNIHSAVNKPTSVKKRAPTHRRSRASLAPSRLPGPDLGSEDIDPVALLQGPALFAHVTADSQIAGRPPRRGTPNFTETETTRGKAAIKRQLYEGFMDAGRADLAKMVGTKAFDVWINQESGWVVDRVSGPINQGKRNGSLFQFWYGHAWTQEYAIPGSFTASAYQQARLVAKHFSHLTPAAIRGYAKQIRAGTYRGWG